MEDSPNAINLSNKKIKKLTKPTLKEAQVTSLILDDNELQRLDNIDSYTKLQELSAVRNQLLRMYGVCRLHNLHTLNLAHNGILTIEGLKELTNLKWLCLAGNNIKIIEHLSTNVKLEYVDLSENSITHISDFSHMKSLKELYLHNNKINHLRQCDRFLPVNLQTLTLANNNIGDLNEVSQLSHLTNLTSISIANNPCVNMAGGNIGFDYRPFIINWCMNVNVIDGFVVGAIESLRAEWLYSQGRGRHFRVGDQKSLVQYLATVCPLNGETLETEEDRKLRLILSKAQHHQQQLINEQLNPGTAASSPATRKKFCGPKSSPRLSSTRKLKSPDRMSTSCFSPISSMSRLAKSPDRMTASCFVPRCNNQKSTSPDRMSSSCYSPNISSVHRGSPDRMTVSCYSPSLSRTVNTPDRIMADKVANSMHRSQAKSPDMMTSSYYSPNLSSNRSSKSPETVGFSLNTCASKPAKSPDRSSSCSSSRNSRSPDQITAATNVETQFSISQTSEPSALLRQNTITVSKATYNGADNMDDTDIGSPLPAESEMLPVPESLMSPEYRPLPFVDNNINTAVITGSLANKQLSGTKIAQPVTRSPKLPRSAPAPGRARFFNTETRKHSPSPIRRELKTSNNKKEVQTCSSVLKRPIDNNSHEEILISRSSNIHFKDEEQTKMEQRSAMEEKVEKAAVCIQKIWRGYHTRNRDKEVQEVYKRIRAHRADQYIRQLATDMETAKLALESERKIQMLQTEAITALWKKVSALEPCLGNNSHQESDTDNFINLASRDNAQIVRQLAQTCNVLQNQIQQLQHSMQDIVKVMSVFSKNVSLTNSSINQKEDNATATQTEIVAVRTPQGDTAKNFPFQKHSRPASLPLSTNQNKKDYQQTINASSELKQYAGNLAEDVIKTLSESKQDDIEPDSMENTTASSIENLNSESSEQEQENEQVNLQCIAENKG